LDLRMRFVYVGRVLFLGGIKGLPTYSITESTTALFE
jgi:hypothetical protein